MPKHLPSHPNLENLKKQAKQLTRDHKSGQVDAFARIKAHFPSLADASVGQILAAEFSLCNAQLVIAREYGFATWGELSAAVESSSAAGKGAFVGVNPDLRRIEAQVAQLAPTQVPVLILGETGTGKALVARTIHRLSRRQDAPFLQLDCAAFSDILADSDLFGHEEGAFTGACARRLGKVELARGGSLFLDQVDALEPALQAKLLVLLTEGAFERVGGTETLQADVRVLVATNADLDALVQADRFRSDLALLLQRVALQVPALRERRADIPELAAHFAGQMAEQLNRATPQLSPRAVEALQGYSWPGNVSELELKVQRAVVVCGAGPVGAEHLALTPGSPVPSSPPPPTR
jgi:DNA-binding NtrC family response regulator